MAAPHLPPEHPRPPGAQRASTGRPARLGELAARLAELDAAHAGRHPTGSPTPDPDGAPPSDPVRRRSAEAPGHPEDDLGDPEAVAKAICLRLLTGAARPRAGLAEALRRRGIPDDVAIRVLDRLTEVGLIDDRAYAEAFVATKHRDRGLGAAALRTELHRKGVDTELASSAAAAVDAEAERRRAEAFLARRVDAAMAAGYPAARRRLLGLLARRGYSADVAVSVVDQALAAYREEAAD